MSTPEIFYDSEEIKKGNSKEFPNSLESVSRPVTKEEKDLTILRMKTEDLFLKIQEIDDEINEILEKTASNLN